MNAAPALGRQPGNEVNIRGAKSAPLEIPTSRPRMTEPRSRSFADRDPGPLRPVPRQIDGLAVLRAVPAFGENLNRSPGCRDVIHDAEVQRGHRSRVVNPSRS